MNTLQTLRSPLAEVIRRYVTLKQVLGRKYANEQRVLTDLDTFLVEQGSSDSELTADTFARWCGRLERLTPTVRRNWMRVVRNLCLYRTRSDPGCFVPDPSTFPRPHKPRLPYLFTERDIVRLLRVADELCPTPNSPLCSEVFRLAIVLLYTTGMRRGELTRLTLSDYDPEEQTLRIRATKFHKSRILPLSADTAYEMKRYLRRRHRLPHGPAAPLLCSRCRGLRPYTGAGLAQGLQRLFRRAGITTSSGQSPRVHDLRHSFALAALQRWYRRGQDVQAKLPALATYMGHVSIISTCHYLQHFEPLALIASERFARHCAGWPGVLKGEDR
jgi:integrase/recombinase XerD